MEKQKTLVGCAGWQGVDYRKRKELTKINQ